MHVRKGLQNELIAVVRHRHGSILLRQLIEDTAHNAVHQHQKALLHHVQLAQSGCADEISL